MSTLTFSYKADRPKARVRRFALSRVDDLRAKGARLYVRDATCVYSRNSDVYRATLRRGSNGDKIPVVCKVKSKDFDDMQSEARIYKRLEKCQGETIPLFYGLFEGQLGDSYVMCMVLEDCGAPLDKHLREMSWDFKVGAIGCIAHIHENGVQHNDIATRNFVIRPSGQVCLIDFDNATEHQCKCKATIMFHTFEPDIVEFGCIELYEAAQMMAIWLPSGIRYIGGWVHIKWAKNVALLASRAPKWVDPDIAFDEACDALTNFKKYLEWRSGLPSV